MGADRGIHTGLTTFFTRDLDIPDVVIIEVAAEGPALVGPDNVRAGTGEQECQEESEPHSVVHVAELVNWLDQTDMMYTELHLYTCRNDVACMYTVMTVREALHFLVRSRGNYHELVNVNCIMHSCIKQLTFTHRSLTCEIEVKGGDAT